MGLAIEDYCEAVSARALTHFAVVGMSAATWQYPAGWVASYDESAAAMLGTFRKCGVVSGSDAAELPGLRLSGSIGRAHPDSERIACHVYKAWLRRGFRL